MIPQIEFVNLDSYYVSTSMWLNMARELEVAGKASTSVGLEYTLEISLDDFADRVIEVVAKHSGTRPQRIGYGGGHNDITAKEVMVHFHWSSRNKDDEDSSPRRSRRIVSRSHETGRAHIDITVYGEVQLVAAISAELDELFADSHLPSVTWWFEHKGEADSRSMIIDPARPTYSEYYPYIPGGIEKFFEGFLDSSATLLFMMGAPGTGKTSLLRWFITKYALKTFITYEQKLLDRDSIFIDFLTGDNSDIFIIEDADLMVKSRENDDNKLVSRFLNVSDGLIKFRRKKVVFTTNLHNFDHVDDALIRRGRCYGTIECRALSYEESVIAAQKGGLPIPFEHKNYTLADLFNQNALIHEIRRKVGF